MTECKIVNILKKRIEFDDFRVKFQREFALLFCVIAFE